MNKIKMFTYDRSGNKVFHQNILDQENVELWPYEFANQIQELLEKAKTGEIHSLNVWWSAQII